MGKATDEIKNILRGKFLVEGKEATRNWFFISFLFALGVIMIASSHMVDRKVHQIARRVIFEIIDNTSRKKHWKKTIRR